MRQTKIPTIIGIIILVLSVVAGVFLVQYRQIFRSGAAGNTSPKNVRTSNIYDSSLTVTWTTDQSTAGFVNWGESSNSLNNVAQDDAGSSGFTHSTTMTNLKSQTTYFFKINSDGVAYDNNGTLWQVKTGPTLPQQTTTNLISGSILATDGSPSKNAIVYVSISGYLLSTLTSQNGSWVVQLAQARSLDLSNYSQIDSANTVLQISVDAGPAGVASAQIYAQSAKPAPPLTLGKVSDFKNLPANNQGVIPQASVDVGTQATATPSSGFNVPQGSATPTTKTVTLQSVNEGEVISSDKPEFFGNGPAGTSITINVQSNPISASLQIPLSGAWKWSPPSGLGEGVHTITITWKDATGITRSLTRNFVVQAAEGPAFVSSPSGTPTRSPMSTPTVLPISTPTASATPTIIPTAIASATAVPQTPVSGSLTPTLILFIMGLGITSLSVLLWKYSEF